MLQSRLDEQGKYKKELINKEKLTMEDLSELRKMWKSDHKAMFYDPFWAVVIGKLLDISEAHLLLEMIE